MTPTELINSCRQDPTAEVLAQLVEAFSFQPGLLEDGYPTDAHLEFRVEIVEALLPDFSLTDLALIRSLFKEEMACETAIQRHDSLQQLCFYLHELRQLEDTFRLYEAKFLTGNMDVACILDREMLTVNHEVPEVVRYVEAVFQQQPQLRTHYPTILEELDVLLTDPTYDSLDVYRTYIRGYFYRHKDGVTTAGTASTGTTSTTELSGYDQRLKPWWKFW